MKKNILSIIFVSLLLPASYAQNFQSVNSGREAYFTFDGSFNFLKIDSVKTLNGDSIFYPSRSLEYVDYDCYSRFAPSWAGSKIIIQNDGTNIYVNHNNDSIVIKTRAGLNGKWNAYQISSSLSIWAEVTECKYDSILGLCDSIKTIRFQALDSTANPIDNPVNQMELLLSQHYGWKKALNFNLFPNLEVEYFPYQYFQVCNLIGLSNPKAGRQNLTWFDVFDFDPGDVLHVYQTNFDCCWVSTCTMNQNWTIYTYLDRADYPDSIVYHVAREMHTMITQYTDTVSTELATDTIREVIKPYPAFDLLPGEINVSEDSGWINLVDQYGNSGSQHKYFSESFTDYERDSCWEMLIYDGGGPSDYIEGLGGGYHDYNQICSRNLRELKYYKKGDREWGTPFDFTGIETLCASNEIKVYPNPANETVCIDTKGTDAPIIVELYSADGSRVMKEYLPVGDQSIDVSGLNPGLYFYTVTVENRQWSSGKITITH